MQVTMPRRKKYGFGKLWSIFGGVLFLYLFLGFMVFPCWDTLKSIFTAVDGDPFAVIRFFFAGNMPSFIWNSLKLAIFLVITVNVVGVSIVLLTEYFDIKGAKILRLGYMTTLIYSGVALVTGYMFLYDQDGLVTKMLIQYFPNVDKQWFSGFWAVLFTMTFACTSNHALFLRNAIRGIDYNTVEAARNMGSNPFGVLFKVVMPTLLPTLFSLTVMTFITGLCAMSAPTLLHYDSINPEIVRLAGAVGTPDDFSPEGRAALLSIILAIFTVVLLTVLNHYERKGHYLSVSKTKAKLVKQKIRNPIANVLTHIYAYVLFIIYMTPVVMIIIFALQSWRNAENKIIDFTQLTASNFFGTEKVKIPKTGRSGFYTRWLYGLFSYEKTSDSIVLSFILSAIAAAAVCVIVVLAVNYIFKHKKAKTSRAVEAGLLFPWLLPTILICYSYRIYFKENLWYVFGESLSSPDRIRLLLIIAYVVVKLPFTLRMIKASFYAIDEELDEAARNLGSGPVRSFMRIRLPIVLPSVLAVFALNFNALFSEYDMSATFANAKATTLAMVVKALTDTGNNSNQLNMVGCRCAATVFIMIVSGIILYLVYGVGSRDLAERLNMREKRMMRVAAEKKPVRSISGLVLGIGGAAAAVIAGIRITGLNAETAYENLPVDTVAPFFLLFCLGALLTAGGAVLCNRGRRNPQGKAIGIAGIPVGILFFAFALFGLIATWMIMQNGANDIANAFFSMTGIFR